jgi:hypothetical protein
MKFQRSFAMMTRIFGVLAFLALAHVPAWAEEQGKPKLVEPCQVEESTEFLGGFLEDFGIKADGVDRYPAEVKCFIESAALCGHFAGEEGYDEERRQEIHRALDKYCPDARARSKGLKEKYRNDTAIRKIAEICENTAAVCASFSEIQDE